MFVKFVEFVALESVSLCGFRTSLYCALVSFIVSILLCSAFVLIHLCVSCCFFAQAWLHFDLCYNIITLGQWGRGDCNYILSLLL